MTIERRHPQGDSLRAFFQQQFNALGERLEGWRQQRQAEQAHVARLDAATEELVDQTNKRLRYLGDYREQLRLGVNRLLEHVDNLVSAVPATLDIRRSHFIRDAQLRAFFVSAAEMAEIFGLNRTLRGYFKQYPGETTAYLILSMRKTEKHSLGSRMQGEMMLRDVAQTVVEFSDYRIRSPRVSETAVRTALKTFLFEHYTGFMQAHLTRISRPTEPISRTVVRNWQDPKVYMEELLALLNNVERLLKVEQNHLQVDHFGVVLDEEPDPEEANLRLQELEVNDLPHGVLVLASYPRDEMLEPPGGFAFD